MTIKNQWLKKPNIKNEELLDLYKNGLSGTQIGIKLNLAKSSVTRRLKKMGIELRGSSEYKGKDRYWLWKGDTHLDEITRKYNQRKLRKWSLGVRERDGHVCVDCGADNVRLHSHHLVRIEESVNTPLEFDIANGVTLCVKCHKNRHKIQRG